MQKLLWVTFMFLLIFMSNIGYLSATSLRPLTDLEKEEIQKLPNICSIDWNTYKEWKNYINESSFPRLAIPVAYNWACNTLKKLSFKQEALIEEKLLLFFEKHLVIEYKWWWMQAKYPMFTMNGTKFISSNYYPYIQKKIKTELELQSPNYQKIAILNYAAWLTWDAYYFPRFQHVSTFN